MLADAPAYVWGLRQIAAWSRELGDAEGFGRAAERMAAAAPHDPEPLVWAGHAALAGAEGATGSRLKAARLRARTHFERALALDPRSGGAAQALFDLLLDDGDPGRSRGRRPSGRAAHVPGLRRRLAGRAGRGAGGTRGRRGPRCKR